MKKRQTILIIEDEAVNRMIIKNILKAEYDILEAENGAEGINILEAHSEKISAVLLDLTMPVMDGFEFLRETRNKSWNAIPIIVMTGSSDVETEKKVLDEGAWDFIPKPYDVKILNIRLHNAIARSQVDAYKEMTHMTEHDLLTKLHNRSKMFSNTKIMLEQNPQQQFVFLRGDIDNFALYNGAYGENEGDKLLCFCADLIRKYCTTVSPCTYGRISADIFCACVPWDGNFRNLVRETELLQVELHRYRKDYVLDISVGICVVDQKLSVEDLYYRASLGSKKCKNKYGIHVGLYDEEEVRKASAAVMVTNEMEKALKEEQFVIYVQPKFQVKNDRVCGGEALVRWYHPQKGLISPGAFIPIFENNGFISKVDYYVWDHTCRLLQKWIAEGKKPQPISVNISRVSLYNPNLDHLLKRLVEKYQIDPSLLELEITESAYMTSPELMHEMVEKLHQAGFVILMDDFGSEYSSLNTLKNIHMDVLKVDMNFIPKDDEVEKGEIILASIIKMAKWLGMSVIVEGVETRRQRDFLEGAGCDKIQGYYYSKPVPSQEYEEKYVNTVQEEEIEVQNVYSKKSAALMVIDDEKLTRAIIRSYFANKYEVIECENAEEGLVYLRRNPDTIKLILVDNMMPGMCGLDFLRYCQYSNELHGIPKVMITASDKPEDQVAAFEAGAYDFITKPWLGCQNLAPDYHKAHRI